MDEKPSILKELGKSAAKGHGILDSKRAAAARDELSGVPRVARNPFFKRVTTGLSVGVFVYMVFFAEYDQKDHCFVPIRTAVTRAKDRFFYIKGSSPEKAKGQGQGH